MGNLRDKSLLALLALSISCYDASTTDNGFMSSKKGLFEGIGNCEEMKLNKAVKEVKIINNNKELEPCVVEGVEFWNRQVPHLNLFYGGVSGDNFYSGSTIGFKRVPEIINKNYPPPAIILGQTILWPMQDCTFIYANVMVIPQDIEVLCDTVKHELGHALGLAHDTVLNSIMTPRKDRKCPDNECIVTRHDLDLLNSYFSE